MASAARSKKPQRKSAKRPLRPAARKPAPRGGPPAKPGPGVVGLHHVFLGTGRFDDTWRFWKDVVGLAEISTWGDGAYRAGAVALGDASLVVAAEQEGRFSDLGYEIKHGTPQLFVRVRGLEAVFERMRARGAQVLREPHRTHWGARAFAVQAPERLVVVFIED